MKARTIAIIFAPLLLGGCAALGAMSMAGMMADIAVSEREGTQTYVAEGLWKVCDTVGWERNPAGGCK